MILAAELITNLGLIVTAIGTLVGAWALIQAKRTEKKSATREEVQQAFDLQGEMLERFERDNDKLRVRVDQLHTKVNDAIARAHQAELKEMECDRRLRIAEAKILELGG